MKTYIFEGVVTALSSISHNAGELNGITQQLRREKFVQPGGDTEMIPVISGNAVRGILRDVGMQSMLQKLGYTMDSEGEVKGLNLPAFYLLFSGGALSSTGDAFLNIDDFRELRRNIPLLGVFGGAVGNSIMPGKLKVGKLIPICWETKHLIPEKFHLEEMKSVWEYCQEEMYTRKDDEKNENIRGLIDQKVRAFLSEPGKKLTLTGTGPQQMLYKTETIAAGTKFYWKLTLQDVSEIEFESFLSTLLEFGKSPHIGGKSNIGLGEIKIDIDKWVEINPQTSFEGKEVDVLIGQKYENHLAENEKIIKEMLDGIK